MSKFQKITIAAIILIFSLGVTFLYAEPDMTTEDEQTKEEETTKSICPTTRMNENCLYCHTKPSFKLKETDSVTEHLDLPYNMSIVDDGKSALYFYYVLDDITPNNVLTAFRYMDRHPELPGKIVIEVHSPGGHAFDGWRIVNIIREYWPKYDIETRLNGMAFSAGFMIFEAGERRCASPNSELMWHEIAYYEFLAKNTPTGTEGKAKMMRHLQDTANTWLSDRTGGKLTKDEIDERSSGQAGWWFNGREALEFGFADDCNLDLSSMATR